MELKDDDDDVGIDLDWLIAVNAAAAPVVAVVVFCCQVSLDSKEQQSVQQETISTC